MTDHERASLDEILDGREPQIRTHDFAFKPDRDQRPGIQVLQISRLALGGGWSMGTDVDMRMADIIALREAIDRYLTIALPCSCGGGYTVPATVRELTGHWIPHGEECVFWLAGDERTEQERKRLCGRNSPPGSSSCSGSWSPGRSPTCSASASSG